MVKKADIGVGLYLLCAVIFFIIPIPSLLLDVMLAINIGIALIILFNVLFVKEVLDMSFFPTLLLFTTIFRISLNVSSTRLILSTGNPGVVVQTFCNFVGGGNLVIGAIVFIVLVIIQFIVINKGSERVAEVTARFTLDAMPGKQMAIDADLNTGAITDKEAKERREKIQKDEFKFPLFPTTTIGSFPQTAEVRANRKAFRTGEISKEQYIEFNKKKIAECIALQEELGLDVLVHGEFERNDMVEYFGQHLEGYLFTEKAWVQSYGTRCVKPPVIWGDISRAHPITVDWSVYAQSKTDKPLKGMLTGPVTILNWSFPREDIPIKQSVLQLALALRDEVLDLEKKGIKIIQIDEAALREKLPLRKSDWYSKSLNFAIP